MKEYVIWGVAPDQIEESLLVSEKAKLQNRESAKIAISKLKELGCSKMRIQEIDFSEELIWNASEMLSN